MNLKVSYKEHMKKISKVIQCKKRIFEIDNADTLFDIVSFAKGFSIVAIVLFHLIHDFMSDMPKVVILASIFGGSGVHVFFVCSGVGLFFSYLKNTVKWGEYIVKRIKKVYIPYFIVVVVSFFVPWYCLDEGYNKLGALFSHIFLYKMFSPTYEVSLGRQLWFISTIIQFYLVFYLLCKIYERVNKKCFFCITMTSSIIWWMLVILTNHSSERVWNAFFLQYLWEFALGMIIAEMIFRGGRISCRIWKIILLSVLGIGLEAVMGMGNSVTKSLNDIACLVGFGGLTIVIYTLKITFVHRIIEYMSKISYELYLTHWLVFSVFYHYISPNGWEREVVSGIIAFGLSILVAKLFQIVLHKVLGLNYKLKSI